MRTTPTALMPGRKTIGIFGGTFDPIHLGHLRLALELKQRLALDEMRLLPCHLPPHRALPQVTSAQRVQMLRLALQDCPDLQLDARELARDKPSYTYDTLCELRAELGADVSLCLCMGADSFAGLTTWHRWRELMALAHLVVVARPGWELASAEQAATSPAARELQALVDAHRCESHVLTERPAGGLVLLAPRLMPISATEIRALIAAGQSPQFLLPDAVWHFIQMQGWYR